MEESSKPSDSTDVGLQTDEENQELADNDLSEDRVSVVPSVRDEVALQEQDQNFSVQREGVQSMDEQLHTDNEESPEISEDLHTGQDMVSKDHESGSAEKPHKPEAEPTPQDSAIDPAFTGQQLIGDQTASELGTDLPEKELVTEATLEEYVQIINHTEAEDITVSQREEEDRSGERDTFDKKISSDISSPTATGNLLEWSSAALL